MHSYAKIIGAEKHFHGVQRQFEKAEEGIREYKWLEVYQKLNTFRTSMPTEWVCDFAEKERRGIEYDRYTVDIVTLLRRAEALRYNEKIPHPEGKMGMLTVKGYGRYKKVWVMPTFDDEDCGVIKTTADYPYLTFIQEGHKTSVSHLMTLRDHIFTVVPRNIQGELDWRLPVFECGKHFIAFDGTALLLKEIYHRAS